VATSSYARHADRLAAARRVADPAVFAKLVDLVTARVEAIDGRPLADTPLVRAGALAAAVGLDGTLWVKDDTRNVAGSHKVRHLVGLALHTLATDPDDRRPFAIASCGNAALAAAVVARAIRRDLQVFIPPDADPIVVDRLGALGATVTVCPRVPGEPGDPCFLRFAEVVARREAVPFCCQGSVAPDTFDAGRTLAWEVVDQLRAATGSAVARLDHAFVQVGGGALATSAHLGFADAVAAGELAALPHLHTVQTEGAAPLARAYALVQARAAQVGPAAALAEAAVDPGRFMWPWETEPRSAATGILDDVTYDWLPVVRAMLATGGEAIVVDEATVLEANDLARTHTGIAVDHTGTAGLAGLLHVLRTRPGLVRGDVLVAFTGEDRTPRKGQP
jgi:threonine synthase